MSDTESEFEQLDDVDLFDYVRFPVEDLEELMFPRHRLPMTWYNEAVWIVERHDENYAAWMLRLYDDFTTICAVLDQEDSMGMDNDAGWNNIYGRMIGNFGPFRYCAMRLTEVRNRMRDYALHSGIRMNNDEIRREYIAYSLLHQLRLHRRFMHVVRSIERRRIIMLNRRTRRREIMFVHLVCRRQPTEIVRKVAAFL